MTSGKIFRVLALAAAIMMAAPFAMAESADEAAAGLIKVGADPISFSLIDLEGATINSDDLFGKKAVALVFWSLFCGPCQEELPLVDKVYRRYADKDIKVFAVNLDGPRRGRAVRKYMSSNEFTFDVLWEKLEGTSYVTADAYGIGGTPTMVVIGKDGKVSYAHVGKATEEVLEESFKDALSK